MVFDFVGEVLTVVAVLVDTFKPDCCSLVFGFTVGPDFSEEALCFDEVVGLEAFALGVGILPPIQNLVHRNAL